MMNQELKYEEGKLVAKVSGGVDTDNDGEMAMGADLVVYINAKEAVSEIIKKGVPSWLEKLLSKKKEEEAAAAQQAEPVQEG